MKDINGTEVAVKNSYEKNIKSQISSTKSFLSYNRFYKQSEILVSYLDYIVEPEPYIMMEYLDGAPFSVNDEPVPCCR